MLPAPLNDPEAVADHIGTIWREDSRHPDGSINVLGGLAVVGAMCLALVVLAVARIVYAIGDVLGFNK